jgi:Ca2+-binding RTX toxin-like protein
VVVAVPGSAGGATTIGQLAPSNPPALCVDSPFDIVQESLASGNSYEVPADGVVTSWSHNASAGEGQMLAMKIFRQVEADTYPQVVGHDRPRPLAASTLNTFTVRIPVEAGDLLGNNDGNADDVPNACWFHTGETADVAAWRKGDLGDGESTTSPPPFLGQDEGVRLNVTAIVEPDADGDGWGDETQDGCPIDPITQGHCTPCKGVPATILGTPGNDVRFGTPGRDVMVGGLSGHDTLIGLAGNDLICGGNGRDRLVGGRGRDTLLGGKGNDRLLGSRGRDRLLGMGGRDRLWGGGGPDLLGGGLGIDRCRGGAGVDTQLQSCEL